VRVVPLYDIALKNVLDLLVETHGAGLCVELAYRLPASTADAIVASVSSNSNDLGDEDLVEVYVDLHARPQYACFRVLQLPFRLRAIVSRFHRGTVAPDGWKAPEAICRFAADGRVEMGCDISYLGSTPLPATLVGSSGQEEHLYAFTEDYLDAYMSLLDEVIAEESIGTRLFFSECLEPETVLHDAYVKHRQSMTNDSYSFVGLQLEQELLTFFMETCFLPNACNPDSKPSQPLEAPFIQGPKYRRVPKVRIMVCVE
jgi:hypothetical protein